MKKSVTLLIGVVALLTMLLKTQTGFAQLPNAGSDQVICTDSVFLNANAIAGQWYVISGSGTFVNATLYNTQVKNIGPGSNTYRWLSGGNYDEVMIVNNKPTIANAGADFGICSSTATLAANTPTYGIGSWMPISVGPVITNTLLSNTTVSNLAKGASTFRWTIRNGDCVSSDEVVVTNGTPVANAGVDQLVCGNSVILNALQPLNDEVGQ